MKVRERVRLPRPWRSRASRAMQVILAGIAVLGFIEGRTTIVVNALIGLVISMLPALLERDRDIVMAPALVLWITTAVFLHVVGALGPYQTVWWWDHMTHVLSSSIVAGAGYAGVRAVEEHSTGIHLPAKFLFVFILIFVMAFGVIWELLEFGLGILSSAAGTATILTQYGLGDTMMDLVFDLVGGVVVGVFGEAYLIGITDELVAYLQGGTGGAGSG